MSELPQKESRRGEGGILRVLGFGQLASPALVDHLWLGVSVVPFYQLFWGGFRY